jgi:L-lactate dehydrogenase complex protein LldG
LEEPQVSERENILARVREALTVLAPKPGHAHDSAPPSTTPSPVTRHPSLSEWLPLVGESFEDRLVLYRKNASDLKADFQLANSREELCQKLLELRDREGWQKIGSHAGELTDAGCRALGLPVCRTDQRYDAADLESCDAGITECDALVAQTGSVVVTNRSAGGRALSVLPPHHVVLAKREQLLADLPDAFALLKRKYSSNYPSFMSLITGPSRTGDIERILVLGAHGPKKLTIFCV